VPTARVAGSGSRGHFKELIMLTQHPTRPPAETLAQTIRQQIDQRTGRRLQQLQVELGGNRVTVHASSPSYYLIQLALLAVREVHPSGQVDLDIQVLPARSQAPEGRAGAEGGVWWRQDPAMTGPSAAAGRVRSRPEATGRPLPFSG
jgi:hypothetical protein